jgi:hypothetical protein
MSPREAAQAFYGQDDAAFAEMISKLAVNDPRLLDAFKGTRSRFLASKSN